MKQKKQKQVVKNTHPASGSSSSYLNLIWALLIFGYSFWLYSNTFQHGFVLDDLTQIEQNTLVQQGSKAIPELMVTSYRHGHDGQNSGLYRPMSNVMFAWEYDHAGRQPNGLAKPGIFHRNNVWLFALSCFVLFFALRRMLPTWHQALVGVVCLLYAAHPIHTEVVANIKSRDEILCFLGFVSAVYFLLGYASKGKWLSLAASVLCYTFAQFSKESAITYLAIFPLILWFFTGFSLKKIALTCSFYLIPAVVFLSLMNSILTTLESNHYVDVIQNSLMACNGFGERSATTVAILGRYLWLLLIPYPLISTYSYNHIAAMNWMHWQPLVSLAVYLFLAFWVIKKIKAKDLNAFAVLFFVITMALVSNVVITISWTLGERFLYQPSLAFCIVAVHWLSRLIPVSGTVQVHPLRAPAFAAGLAGILVLYTAATRSRSMDWKDNLTLFSTDLEKAPNNASLHAFVAKHLNDQVENEYANRDPETDSSVMFDPRLEKITALYKKAWEIYPYRDFMNGLGTAYNLQRKYAAAVNCFNLAIAKADTIPDYWHNLGIAWFGLKNYDSSRIAYERVLHLSPNYSKSMVNLANVYNLTGRPHDAIATIRKAIARSPEQRWLYSNLSVYFRSAGQRDSADYYYRYFTGR